MTPGNTTNILTELGWDDFFDDEFRRVAIPDTVPARVILQHKDLCIVQGEYGEMAVTVSGRLRHRAETGYRYPAVGDWVAILPQPEENKGVIQAVLPRKSNFSRQAAGGRTQEQVVAANIDTVFLVSGLDGGRNLNMRRIERYLTLAWNSGARPVIILNKADLCPDIAPVIVEAEGIAPGVPVHAVSATEKSGLDKLWSYLTKGNTVALLGQSGVGKSAIINTLVGTERMRVKAVRESDRQGRHTTTHRELIMLPGGGAVIDTPGMREIQLRGDEEGLRDAFDDIEQLAKHCRFSDCRHDNEPRCAVREAIETGVLDPARFESYRRLQRELRHQAAREDYSVGQEEKLRWKKIAQLQKRLKRDREVDM
jgi:ribosome biogenesis GTPase